MMTLSKYHQNFQETQKLLTELRQSRFLSNDMATFIGAFSRLEENDLFLNKVKDQDQQPHYNLVDCVWAKLAEQLLQLGVRTEIIKTFQTILSEKIEQESYKRIVLEKKQLLLDRFSEAELEEFYKALERCEDKIVDCSAIECLLINAIHQDDVGVLFFLNEPYACLPVSREILTAFAQDPEGLDYQKYMKKPHFYISINNLLEGLIDERFPKDVKHMNFRAVLSETEHKAIQIIRENHKDLKSVLIKTSDDQFQKIEVTKTKRLSAQKFFSQSFKKADYKSVRVEVVDGKTSYIEEIKKYKL